MTSPFAERLQAALWIGAGLLVLALLYVLSPILAPFLLAAILAYICNPLNDRMERAGLPRLVAVLVSLLLIVAVVAGLFLIILPLLYEEATILASRLPEALGLANQKLSPWLREKFGIRIRFDPASLQKLAAANWDAVQVILEYAYQSAKTGGTALLGAVAVLLLTPVAAFYLMLDWNRLLDRIDAALPRRWRDKTAAVAGDIDAVLSEFLRGQTLVMLVLAAYYSLALWIIGLPSALSVGVVTGLLIFIPYIGFATGFALALLVALLQFTGWGLVIAVLIVYGIGQLLESFLLTPFLVGERIGLHPLAVIFALMAFGQLFGFFGVLAALPASAALLVGLRELRTLYLASPFYKGSP